MSKVSIQREDSLSSASGLVALLLGSFVTVFVLGPLLFFGRHVIYQGVQLSLYRIASSVDAWGLSSSSLWVLATTVLGIGVLQLLSSLTLLGGHPSAKVATKKPHNLAAENATKDSSHSLVDDQSPDNLPVQVESEERLDEYPLLLSMDQRQALQNHVLPASLVGYKWKRLYAVARDGDAFFTCVHKLEGHRRTLWVVQTATSPSRILGAYCERQWRADAGPAAFDGGSATCLYTFEKDAAQVNVYRWTGENRFFALLDRGKERIAFGGGNDAFGLCLDTQFTRGSSASCATFGNPPLGGDGADGNFGIMGLEVFGFSVV